MLFNSLILNQLINQVTAFFSILQLYTQGRSWVSDSGGGSTVGVVDEDIKSEKMSKLEPHEGGIPPHQKLFGFAQVT